ncbi:MAG: Nif3-like dinuclear metal center hexameric protein [Firmicutes bacterium]|nr:Nif3-like dinuclear metal center hexameric protein [Bacillota bacterium]
MKYRDFISLMEEIAPTEAYRDIDNSGPQIFCGNKDIQSALVCLEINRDVLKEADEKGADLILTHHPLIFEPESCINYNDYPGRYIHEAVRKGISVYSAHLSFDFAAEGNNAYLAKLLRLTDVEAGSISTEWRGHLPEAMSLEDVCRHVENSLSLPEHYIRCVDGGRDLLRKVGLCTGAGGSYIPSAAAAGCDLFITGDLKLHEAQYAKAAGISVIDAGHYGTEKIFTGNMAHQLRQKALEKNLDIDVIMAEADTNPYTL